jgi:hypothetical protein
MVAASPAMNRSTSATTTNTGYLPPNTPSYANNTHGPPLQYGPLPSSSSSSSGLHSNNLNTASPISGSINSPMYSHHSSHHQHSHNQQQQQHQQQQYVNSLIADFTELEIIEYEQLITNGVPEVDAAKTVKYNRLIHLGNNFSSSSHNNTMTGSSSGLGTGRSTYLRNASTSSNSMNNNNNNNNTNNNHDSNYAASYGMMPIANGGNNNNNNQPQILHTTSYDSNHASSYYEYSTAPTNTTNTSNNTVNNATTNTAIFIL